jgi:glycosyltransferase involved in cell wall biosynthesis
MSRVEIVIPCFDGARRVGEVVRGALGSGLPVVVIDDGSGDDSATVAREAGASFVLRHPRNQGKGAALRTGFRFAFERGADAVLTLDADGQHDPGEIPALLAAHAAHPDALVIGVRSFAPEAMPRRSRIGNRISTFWIGRFAGRRFADTQSGFRVYPRALLALPSLRTRRFDTETELLLCASKLGVPVIEVPVRTIYDDDRVTHFHGLTDTLRVLGLVIASPLWGRRLRRLRDAP